MIASTHCWCCRSPGRPAPVHDGAGGRPVERRHPVHHHQHPGLGAARRAGAHVREADRADREDDLGRHRAGAGPGGARRGRRHARPRAGPREEVRRRGQDAQPAPRHVQRLRRHRPAPTIRRRSRASRRRWTRSSASRRASRASSRAATSRAPTCWSWRCGSRRASSRRAPGTSSPARAWGRPSASPTTGAPTR